MKERYSNIKALRFPDHLAAIRAREVAPPIHVQLVLSDLCNQSCSFCSYRDPTYHSSQLFHVDGNYNPNRKLSFEKVIEILDDCAMMGVKAIQFTGGGEPTVHPDFQRIVSETSARGLKWGLITNAVRLEKLDVSAAAWIRISVDAATAETYCAIRSVPKAHFDRALAAIERLRCGVGFVVTEANWREVAEATRLFKRLGASSVRIAPQFTATNALAFYEAARPLVEEAISEETDTFRIFSRFADKYAEVQSAPTEPLCGYQFFTTYVGADENLYRCCVYAYNPHGFLSSLKGRRFRDVWPEVAASFHKFNATKCVGCHYQDINRVLGYVLAPQAQDEEFV